MSKTIGNVIDPLELIKEFGADAVRYYLLAKIPTFEDGDLTKEHLREVYNGDLANGLGNLASRIMKLAEDNLSEKLDAPEFESTKVLDGLEIQKAMNQIWKKIGELDLEIQEKKPWESKDKDMIKMLVVKLAEIAHMLKIFLPDTSEKILNAIKENKKPENLFPRINA